MLRLAVLLRRLWLVLGKHTKLSFRKVGNNQSFFVESLQIQSGLFDCVISVLEL